MTTSPAPKRPFRRRLIVNTAAISVANIWAIVVALFTLPLMLRGLGREGFGVWALLQTFSAFNGWLSLADLGVGTAAHRRLAQHCANDELGVAAKCAASVLIVFVAAGVVAGALFSASASLFVDVFGLSGSLRTSSRAAVGIFGVQIALDMFMRGAQACFEGMNRIDVSRMIDIARRTVVGIAVAIAANRSHTVSAVCVVSVVCSVPSAIAGFAIVRQQFRGHELRPSISELRQLLHFGGWVLLLRSVGTLHRGMDRVIVGIALGPSAVALIEAATQVQNGAESILSASSYAVTPASSWLDARGDTASLRELALRGTRYSVLLTLPFVVLPTVLAGPLVAVWLGSAGAGVVSLVPLALAYTAVMAPAQVLSNLLVGRGDVRSVLRPAVVSVLVNLALTLVLVDSLGAKGAFLASLIAAAFLIVPLAKAGLDSVDESVGAFLRHAVWPAFVVGLPTAAATSTIVLLPLSDLFTVIVGGGVGLAAYLVMMARSLRASGELAELLGVLRPRSTESPVRGPNGSTPELVSR
jgi:O-antigen/teichoic acid export membrane protein